MDGTRHPRVLVQVVELQSGREIGWGANVAEQLTDRLDDIHSAISAGAQAVAQSLEGLNSPAGWQLSEVSAAFGITLTAEAGVILSKASAETTFEVTVTYQRNG